MKKFLITATLLFVCMFLIGCSSKTSEPQRPELLSGFEADCIANIDDMQLKGRLKWRGADGCVVDVIEPSSLSGMSVELAGDTARLKYGILEKQLKISDYPQAAYVNAVNEALKSYVAGTDIKSEAVGDFWKFSGFSENMEYIIVVNPQTKSILSLDIPDLNISIIFENYLEL